MVVTVSSTMPAVIRAGFRQFHRHHYSTAPAHVWSGPAAR
jgi:phage gp16-like protein